MISEKVTIEYSVSEISQYVKRTLEDTFGNIRVRGEISGFKHHSSGHVYFNLKDESAVLNAVCWRANFAKISFKPEDGMEIIITGNITSFPGRSNYQINVKDFEIAGIGTLLAKLEEKRKKFAAEGLFDQSRKQKLPMLPKSIGVVTSPTGAVIRDILHRVKERCPLNVKIWPVAVQGLESAEQIAAAIAGFNNLASGDAPEVIIIARGGGSIEDLWSFNEEIVVRAIAASKIPIISAVGHETDFTLADYVADVRAPTPTAAAEIAVPKKSDITRLLEHHVKRLSSNMLNILQVKDSRLKFALQKLRGFSYKIDIAINKISSMQYRLNVALTNQINTKQAIFKQFSAAKIAQQLVKIFDRKYDKFVFQRSRIAGKVERKVINLEQNFNHLIRLINSYDYKKVLKRGFAMILDKEGELIKSIENLKQQQKIKVKLFDGEATLKCNNPQHKKASTRTEQQDMFENM